MKVEDFKLNEYELISYADLRNELGTDYYHFYKRLNIVGKKHSLSSHWIKPERLAERLDDKTENI